MRQLTRTVVLVPAVLMLASGCATKDWVKELVGQKEARIDERVGGVDQRVGTVEGRVGRESERVTKVEGQLTEKAQRLGTLETAVGEVGQQARQARGRADEASVRAEQTNDRLSRLWNGRHRRNLVETVHVQFGFDRADLSDAAQTALLTIVKELKENPNLTVDLEGYTDATGAREYNLGLSQRRVEAVRRYLIENGTELPRIHSIGLGPLPGAAAPQEHAKQRRVTLRLMVHPE